MKVISALARQLRGSLEFANANRERLRAYCASARRGGVREDVERAR